MKGGWDGDDLGLKSLGFYHDNGIYEFLLIYKDTYIYIYIYLHNDT